MKMSIIWMSLRQFKDEKGCLPEDSNGDGMHFGGKYYNIWFDYLKTHTVTEE